MSILINDDSSATLLTSFDTMYSLNYCGRKASELSSKFSKHQCLFLSGDDLELKQSFVDQLLRCLLHNCSDVNRKISFIVDLTNCSSGSLTGDDVSVARLLKSWAAEVVADYPAVRQSQGSQPCSCLTELFVCGRFQ